MGTKRTSDTPIPPSQSQHHQLSTSGPIKQEGYGSTAHRLSRRSESSTPIPMTDGTEPLSINRTASAMGNPSYYNGPMATPNAAYPQMGYTDFGQPAGHTPTTGASGIQSSYIPAAEETSPQYMYAAATPSQPVSAAHNHIAAAAAYGSQQQQQQQQQPAADPHSQAPGGGDWTAAAVQQHDPLAGNTWHAWTSAIALMDASTQDRYSANALLTLNAAGQRGPGADDGVDIPVVSPDDAAQWPMLLYKP